MCRPAGFSFPSPVRFTFDLFLNHNFRSYLRALLNLQIQSIGAFKIRGMKREVHFLSTSPITCSHLLLAQSLPRRRRAKRAEGMGVKCIVYVDQSSFDQHRPTTLAALAESFTKYKA